jgi:hypothetical protein
MRATSWGAAESPRGEVTRPNDRRLNDSARMHSPADTPSEQDYISKDRDRAPRRQSDRRGGNPNADLRHSNSTTLYSRIMVIDHPEHKKRHPAQQIEMSVRGHRRVILRDGHDDAPDHADPSMWRQRRMLRL